MGTCRRVFGELELAVLEAVRAHEHLTVKQLQELLGGRDRYTTVMTVMARLAEKGELRREKEGRHYVYRIPSRKSSDRSRVLELLKRKLFGGRAAGMIAYLLESTPDISADEIDRLQKLIDEVKAKESSK